MQQGLHQQDRTEQQVRREWLLVHVKVLTVAIDEEHGIGNGQCSTAQCGECGTGCYKLFSFLQLSGGGAAERARWHGLPVSSIVYREVSVLSGNSCKRNQYSGTGSLQTQTDIQTGRVWLCTGQ